MCTMINAVRHLVLYILLMPDSRPTSLHPTTVSVPHPPSPLPPPLTLQALP